MKKTKTIEIPEFEDCAFLVEAMPEDMRIEGNASAIDDETDKEIAEEIQRQLESGNVWAWCTVKVTCYYDAGLDGINGAAHLGGCSYSSEEDFVSGGYFEDMKQEAYKDFVQSIFDL